MNGSDIKALVDRCIDQKTGVLTVDQPHNPFNSTRINTVIGTFFGGRLTAAPGAATVGATGVSYAQASLQTASFALYPQSGAAAAVISFTTGGDGNLDL